MNAITERNYQLVSKMLKPLFDVFIDSSIMGPQNFPEEGPGIIVSNHRSDLDPFAIMTNVRRPINWLGAKYLWNVPFVGVFFDFIGGIPVSKYKSEINKAFEKAEECLRQGQLVGIFPEGWNYIAENMFNWNVGDFQTGFARIAFRTGAPVVPVALLGISEKRGKQAFSPNIRKLLDFPIELQYIEGRVEYKKLHINVGRPIPVPADANPDDKDAVNAFTKKVNDAVRKLYSEIPGNIVGFGQSEPVTAIPGIGQPLENDVFADDILEAVKALRRAARPEPVEYDPELIEKALKHARKFTALKKSEDRDTVEMAVKYQEWLKKIRHAAKTSEKIEEKFEPYLKQYS